MSKILKVGELRPASGAMSEKWSVRVESAMYGGAAIGYLYAVLSQPHLEWPGFLMLTLAVASWVALYRYISVNACSRHFPLAFTGLIVASLLAQLAAFWGVQLDWLAPVLTVGFIAAVLPFASALLLSSAIAMTTIVIIALLEGPQAHGTFLFVWDGVTTIPAFAFAFVFSVCLTALENQRDEARQLLAQLEEAHQQLQEHAKEAEELAVVQERNRMAREIHDTLGHYLTLLAVELETALKLEERADGRLRGQLVAARRIAADCLTEVRHSVAALRPTNPGAHSLETALARLRSEYETALPETEITLDIEGPIKTLSPELRVALYRCAQEALTNIRKHARATKALVRLRVDEREVELMVLDNGVGAQSVASGNEPGFGLLGMRERLALLDGVATARPEADHGWRVEARVPLHGNTSGNGVSRPDVERLPVGAGGIA